MGKRMNWLLIVITAGNITFAKIADSETSCEALGKFYTQGIEYTTSYICLAAEALEKLE